MGAMGGNRTGVLVLVDAALAWLVWRFQVLEYPSFLLALRAVIPGCDTECWRSAPRHSDMLKTTTCTATTAFPAVGGIKVPSRSARRLQVLRSSSVGQMRAVQSSLRGRQTQCPARRHARRARSQQNSAALLMATELPVGTTCIRESVSDSEWLSMN